jgi:hypothetical protein
MQQRIRVLSRGAWFLSNRPQPGREHLHQILRDGIPWDPPVMRIAGHRLWVYSKNLTGPCADGQNSQKKYALMIIWTLFKSFVSAQCRFYGLCIRFRVPKSSLPSRILLLRFVEDALRSLSHPPLHWLIVHTSRSLNLPRHMALPDFVAWL